MKFKVGDKVKRIKEWQIGSFLDQYENKVDDIFIVTEINGNDIKINYLSSNWVAGRFELYIQRKDHFPSWW